MRKRGPHFGTNLLVAHVPYPISSRFLDVRPGRGIFLQLAEDGPQGTLHLRDICFDCQVPPGSIGLITDAFEPPWSRCDLWIERCGGKWFYQLDNSRSGVFRTNRARYASALRERFHLTACPCALQPEAHEFGFVDYSTIFSDTNLLFQFRKVPCQTDRISRNVVVGSFLAPASEEDAGFLQGTADLPGKGRNLSWRGSEFWQGSPYRLRRGQRERLAFRHIRHALLATSRIPQKAGQKASRYFGSNSFRTLRWSDG